MPLALALDVGTTSIAAAAVADDSRLVAHIQEPNDSAVPGLPAGYAEQDPLRIWQIACQVLQRLADALPVTVKPHCLGITGQMHGGLALNANRRPLTNLMTGRPAPLEVMRAAGLAVYGVRLKPDTTDDAQVKGSGSVRLQPDPSGKAAA